jgi:CBS domain-containing protein
MFTGDKTVKLTVRECMNLSGNDRFVCLGKEASVLQVCAPFFFPLVLIFFIFFSTQALKALNRVHQHRICIARDPKDKSSVFGVLSQIDLVNYFLLHIEEFGPKMASMPLSELAGAKYLGYAGRVLVSVQSTDSVLFALQLMDRHEITGVPVLRKGKICGTISLADVPRALNHLLSPCMNFLDEGKGREGRALGHDVATVDEDCTFASLLKGFSASNLHRLWVMDGSDLKGVITLTDVMRCLLTLSKEKKKTKKNKEKK